ncbi:MAG: hypothetical protein ACQESD_04665 [Thermoplasmatota archaeon]
MMDSKEVQINLIAGIFMVALLYHSEGYFPLITLIPLGLVSIGYHFDRESLKNIGLAASTITVAVFLKNYSMGDLYSLLIFIPTLIVPLNVYWGAVLSPRSSNDITTSLVALSYLALVPTVFYLLIFLLKIDTYVLSVENLAPQALILSALAAILFIPYHKLSEIED